MALLVVGCLHARRRLHASVVARAYLLRYGQPKTSLSVPTGPFGARSGLSRVRDLLASPRHFGTQPAKG